MMRTVGYILSSVLILAIFPDVLSNMQAHPDGRTWAGGYNNHMGLMRLEGDLRTNTAPLAEALTMPTTRKTVRVFISSTFRDMHAERDHLVRFAFPRLREKLLDRRIHLVAWICGG